MIYDPLGNLFLYSGRCLHPTVVPGHYKKTLLYARHFVNPNSKPKEILDPSFGDEIVYTYYFGIFDDMTWFHRCTWTKTIKPYVYTGATLEYRNEKLLLNRKERVFVYQPTCRYQSPLSVEETLNAMTFLTAHDKLNLLERISA